MFFFSLKQKHCRPIPQGVRCVTCWSAVINGSGSRCRRPGAPGRKERTSWRGLGAAHLCLRKCCMASCPPCRVGTYENKYCRWGCRCRTFSLCLSCSCGGFCSRISNNQRGGLSLLLIVMAVELNREERGGVGEKIQLLVGIQKATPTLLLLPVFHKDQVC